MYNPIFTYTGEIGGRGAEFLFVPDFRLSVASCDAKHKYEFYTDGTYRVSDELTYMKAHKVYVSEDATWFLEVVEPFYLFHVTERAREISTPFGDEFNAQATQILKEAKRKYYNEKKNNLFLYVYSKEKDRLSIFGKNMAYNNGGKYSLSRYFTVRSYIDRNSQKPSEDCYVFGRITRTIGNKDGNHIDFVEPVYQLGMNNDIFPDWLNDYEKKDYICVIGRMLMELLWFTIQKEYDENAVTGQIRKYIEYTKGIDAYVNHVSLDKVIQMFNAEVKKAMENGDLRKLVWMCEDLGF